MWAASRFAPAQRRAVARARAPRKGRAHDSPQPRRPAARGPAERPWNTLNAAWEADHGARLPQGTIPPAGGAAIHKLLAQASPPHRAAAERSVSLATALCGTLCGVCWRRGRRSRHVARWGLVAPAWHQRWGRVPATRGIARLVKGGRWARRELPVVACCGRFKSSDGKIGTCGATKWSVVGACLGWSMMARGATVACGPGARPLARRPRHCRTPVCQNAPTPPTTPPPTARRGCQPRRAMGAAFAVATGRLRARDSGLWVQPLASQPGGQHKSSTASAEACMFFGGPGQL